MTQLTVETAKEIEIIRSEMSVFNTGDVRQSMVRAAQELRADSYRISDKETPADIFLTVSLASVRNNGDRNMVWYNMYESDAVKNVVRAGSAGEFGENAVFSIRRDVYTKAEFAIEYFDGAEANQKVEAKRRVNVNQQYFFTWDTVNRRLVFLQRSGSGENTVYTNASLTDAEKLTVASAALRYVKRIMANQPQVDHKVTVHADAITHYGHYVEQRERESKRGLRNADLVTWHEKHDLVIAPGVPEAEEILID